MPDTSICQHCKLPVTPGAAICTHCGFNMRMGKRPAPTVVTQPNQRRPAFVPRALPSGAGRTPGQGSFALGIILSFAFAAAASVLWIIVAYATGFAIGYIAILIGGAAGVGMRMGHRRSGPVGGVAAAVLALIAIMLAKMIVLELVLARAGVVRPITELDSTRLAAYFFNPMGLLIIAVGVAAAYRTGKG